MRHSGRRGWPFPICRRSLDRPPRWPGRDRQAGQHEYGTSRGAGRKEPGATILRYVKQCSKIAVGSKTRFASRGEFVKSRCADDCSRAVCTFGVLACTVRATGMGRHGGPVFAIGAGPSRACASGPIATCRRALGISSFFCYVLQGPVCAGKIRRNDVCAETLE